VRVFFISPPGKSPNLFFDFARLGEAQEVPIFEPRHARARFKMAPSRALVASAMLLCLAAAAAAQVAGPKQLTTAPSGTSVAAPSKGAFFLCPGNATLPDGTVFQFGTVLTTPNSSWVVGDEIDISLIPVVNGSVKMDHEFEVTLTEAGRRLKGNGIPSHPIGVYPIPSGTVPYSIYSQLPAEGYANAAEIPVAPYNLDVTVPRYPVANDEPTCVEFMLGVSTQTGAAWHMEYAIDGGLNAVDPNAALPTDSCWGHPYETQYHYHGYSWKCFPDQGAAGEHSPLFGYALDGFGIYGPRSENGVLVTNADLDECHGHSHEISWDGEAVAMYHYHTNSEYPYNVGCFRGTPVAMDHGAQGQVSMGNGTHAGGHESSPSESAPTPASAAAAGHLASAACILGTLLLLL
jgi:hypothetical protein